MNTKYLLWILLAAPSVPLCLDFWFDERYYSELMFESGLLSIQLLVLTLCISPLRLLTQKIKWFKSLNRWLLGNRRYFGVACFGYGVIHLLVYLRQYPDLFDILSQALKPEIATGWIAMFALAALALTSNNTSVRRLGDRWRTLHKLVYPIAVLLYLHWYLVGFFLQVLHYWYVPLALFQLYRMIRPSIRFKKPETVASDH